MQVDKTTLSDLSIFHSIEEQSVFRHLDFTTSIGGREVLRQLFSKPLSNLNTIQETQRILQLIVQNIQQWPLTITNGTVMVVDKFYESAIEDMPENSNTFSALLYKLTNSHDYSLTKFSVNHFIDFAKGLQQLIGFFEGHDVPMLLATLLNKIEALMNKPVIRQMQQWEKGKVLLPQNVLTFGQYLKTQYKHEALQLIEIYSMMDAYYGMATACKKFNFCFPVLEKRSAPFIEANQLFHPMLHVPIAYDIALDKEKNFLFLTGANMAGKSTFIKAVGVSVYLAHLGMGVPAKSLKLSLFDGLLSNIQVEDNITKGESYFFNEVQRIKKTIQKINDGRNWLILIDELFKGTNVQDAMKCSIAVIEGLRKMPNALFILSTHLYEIGEGLRAYSNIQFSYFETSVVDDQLVFSYYLKEGISNDRLGYLILKREGVVNMLEEL